MIEPITDASSAAGGPMPHGVCFLWQSELLWLHAVSDGLIAAAYYSIPLALMYFVARRTDLAYRWVFHMFAAFIVFCGTTHLLAVWVLWNPDYLFQGLVKAGTAVVSLATAALLWPLIPRALALPGPAQLAAVNADLRAQVAERARAENAVRELNQALEARVQARTRELERSNEKLRQFAYAASHDLQEPLRVISSYLGLLERRYGDRLDHDATEFIDFAVDGAKRMQDLIRGLLEYTRVGSQALPDEVVDCDAVLAGAMRDLALALRESGAEVTSDPLPRVRGDSAQLANVFRNLIGNAVKYRGTAPPRIHVSARRRGSEWVLGVRDNGPGIDPAHRERIFDVFQRLHTREEIPGSGMGLAICRAIIEHHGGTIRAEAAPDGGSVFVFTLPVPARGAAHGGV